MTVSMYQAGRPRLSSFALPMNQAPDSRLFMYY
jgi:hypothetical protein